MNENNKSNWFLDIPVDFEAGGKPNTPECPDVIEILKKRSDGKRPYNGVKFVAQQEGYKFKRIDIDSDVPDEWPEAWESIDTMESPTTFKFISVSTLSQPDLNLDKVTSDHKYTIWYEYQGKEYPFDPGIRNVEN